LAKPLPLGDVEVGIGGERRILQREGNSSSSVDWYPRGGGDGGVWGALLPSIMAALVAADGER